MDAGSSDELVGSNSNDESECVQQRDPGDSDHCKHKVFQKLEEILSVFGLTPFSRRIAVEYIKVYKSYLDK